MVLARRLPVGGGDTFRVPRMFEVTAAPQGAWPWGNAHRFGVADGLAHDYTYLGFANNAGGIRVAIFDHATGDVDEWILAADGSTSNDQHNCPALTLMPSGHLMAVFCDHNSANIYRRITTNPITTDPTITGGGNVALNLDSMIGGTGYTYPNIHAQGATRVMVHRNIDGAGSNWEYSETTDGDTWSTLVNLTFGERYYMRSCRTSATRIDFAVSNGSYAEDFADIAHFYKEGAGYFGTDGTPLAGSPPFDFADLTLVYDGSSAGVRTPADIVCDGVNIAIVYAVQTGTPSGHLGEDEDYLYSTAPVGGSWTTETVVENVGAKTFEFTEGSLVIDKLDINHLIVSRRPIPDISEEFQFYDYRRLAPGSYEFTQRTDTPDANMYAVVPENAAPELQWAGLRGAFINESTFDTQIVAYGIPA